MAAQFAAKFPGTCLNCGEPIQPGQFITRSEKYNRSYHHVECPKQPSLKPQTIDLSNVKPHQEVFDGKYTIVFEDGSRKTLAVSTVDEESGSGMAGKRIVSYLFGPDNNSNYRGFAFLSDTGRVHMWKRFAENEELKRAASVLVDDPLTAGHAYAIESGNCFHCGRTLTVPDSVHRGLGPICAKKLGIA